MKRIVSCFLLLTLIPSGSIYGKSRNTPEELIYGIPQLSDIILSRCGFSLGYSNSQRQALWVCYILSADKLIKEQTKRSNTFRIDPAVKYQPVKPSADKVPLRTLNGMLFTGRNDIIFVRANGNYSQVTLTMGEEIVLERLGTIETRLGEAHFIRAGRNLLLNRQKIYKVDVKHKSCILRTTDGREYSVDLSAGGMESVEKFIKQGNDVKS